MLEPILGEETASLIQRNLLSNLRLEAFRPDSFRLRSASDYRILFEQLSYKHGQQTGFFVFWRMLGCWDAMHSHIFWSYVLPPFIQHVEAGRVPNLSSDQFWDHSPCYEGPSTCKVKVSCPWNVVKSVLFYMKMGWIQKPLQTNP